MEVLNAVMHSIFMVGLILIIAVVLYVATTFIIEVTKGFKEEWDKIKNERGD